MLNRLTNECAVIASDSDSYTSELADVPYVTYIKRHRLARPLVRNIVLILYLLVVSHSGHQQFFQLNTPLWYA